MDTQILEDIGLTNAQIKTYVTLLELGESTSGPIIEKSKLQSSVVHRALKELIEKGLISYVQIGPNNHYHASDPKTFINYIDDKKAALKDILPELQLKQKLAKEKNQVEMFLGKKALFGLLNGIIENGKAGELYCSFSLIEPHDDPEIVMFYKQYNIRRREKKLDVKVMAHKKVKEIYERHYTIELLRKAKVRYSDFMFPQGLITFQDQVVLISWQEMPVAIKITNKMLAKQYTEFFMNFYNKEKNAY